MKLKYYLQGLGIGILLTTLILTIGGKDKELSKEDIINRAMGLGMVMKEDPGGNLDEVMEDSRQGEPSPEPQPTQIPDSTQAPEPTQTPDSAQAPEPTQILEEEGDAPSPTPAQAQTAEEITFSIEKGMSSGKVAVLLEEKGLVEDAEKFNTYIIKEGKSGLIMIGKYTVEKGSSFEMILDTITQ